MTLTKIDGKAFYSAFVQGAKQVIKRRKELDEINVFPVADGDTGHNLALTMRSIAEQIKTDNSISTVSSNIAEVALMESRGNSGIIFAQFFQGLSKAVQKKKSLRLTEFAQAMKKAVEHTYEGMNEPVEGTVLTVMMDWANALQRLAELRADLIEIIKNSLEVAKSSLQDTPNKLKILRKEGVVDAGAKGFVLFLEGMLQSLSRGRGAETKITEPVGLDEKSSLHSHKDRSEITNRYCTETVLKAQHLNINHLKKRASTYGDSVIVAGSQNKVRIHLHTNSPSQVIFKLRDYGDIIQQKVDDMKRQNEATYNRNADIALVTDSACDLPPQIMDEYQIHMIPLTISFGEEQFLDKVTITPSQFYGLLEEEIEYPQTSQPAVKDFANLYSFLLDNYDSIISLHLSKQLSGTYHSAQLAAREFEGERIAVIDTKHLSTSLGLIVQRVSQKIQAGKSYREVVDFARKLPGKAEILVSVKNLKYMVRGGRVSPLKGFLAKILNLKPIVSLDEEGNSKLYGKAFFRESNIKQMLNMIRRYNAKTPILGYAVGHAHAKKEALKLEERVRSILGQKADYIMDISPLIGSHAGVGAISVSMISK